MTLWIPKTKNREVREEEGGKMKDECCKMKEGRKDNKKEGKDKTRNRKDEREKERQ